MISSKVSMRKDERRAKELILSLVAHHNLPLYDEFYLNNFTQIK